MHQDKIKFDEQTEIADRALRECHTLLSSIEKMVLECLNNLFEEARIILMKKLHPKDYEKLYLRDSNGYIRKDAKLQMNVRDWLDLADKYCLVISELTTKANAASP